MSIVHDYAAIARRLRGEPDPEPGAEVCDECEGGGWIEVYSPRPPAFATCPKCFNPEDLPSP